MTNTYKFAEQELDILAMALPDSIITPFAEEILALCEKFGNSGQVAVPLLTQPLQSPRQLKNYYFKNQFVI